MNAIDRKDPAAGSRRTKCERWGVVYHFEPGEQPAPAPNPAPNPCLGTPAEPIRTISRDSRVGHELSSH